jgi:hypothetical protein
LANKQTPFQDIFPANPAQWPYGTAQKGLAAQIRKNRIALNDVLFFDTILADVGQIPDGQNTRPPQLIVGAKLYPPKNREELRRLHDQIEDSATDTLKKSCLYYYLLKDFKVDGKYAVDAGIPEQFCQLISGFYALDHLQFEVSNSLTFVAKVDFLEGSDSVFVVSGGSAGVHRQDLGVIVTTDRVSQCRAIGGAVDRSYETAFGFN